MRAQISNGGRSLNCGLRLYLCVQAVKAPVKLSRYTGLSKHWLLADVMRTEILFSGSLWYSEGSTVQNSIGLKVYLVYPHWVGNDRKRNQQSMNTDQKSIETVFLIAICPQCGDKWLSKTLFLLIFDLRSLIVLAF